MKKGTILYVGGFELPDKNAAALRVLNIGAIFEELEYKLEYIGLTKSDNYGLTYINEKKVINTKYPKSIIEWINYLTDISLIKQRIEYHKDIKFIVCYNLPAIKLRKILNYCKPRGIKVIGDTTEWYSDNRIIKRLDTNYRMRIINKKIDGNICISSYLFNIYKKKNKNILIPPLINEKEKKWEEINQKNIKDRINLVYSGSPGRNKDKLDIVIETLSEFTKKNKFYFDIVGITKEQFLDYYPEQKDAVDKIENVVSFHGRLKHQDAISKVKRANFQIFLRESNRTNNAGFPSKFVESMRCGTPVITTRISDLDKYLHAGKNGYFVEFNNKENLSIILNHIVHLPKKEIEEMKEFCMSMTSFNYTNYIEEMDVFLNEILSKNQ